MNLIKFNHALSLAFKNVTIFNAFSYLNHVKMRQCCLTSWAFRRLINIHETVTRYKHYACGMLLLIQSRFSESTFRLSAGFMDIRLTSSCILVNPLRPCDYHYDGHMTAAIVCCRSGGARTPGRGSGPVPLLLWLLSLFIEFK